jgi:hypothetical protein
MKKLLLASLLATSIFTFAYFQIDVDNATYLADKGVITTQSTTTGYRLNDNITRAEVVAIALKVKWIQAPGSYKCKKYFSDTVQNDWICRAIEIAADNWLVSKENKKFRPQDKITRSEALAMLMKAGNVVLLSDEEFYKSRTEMFKAVSHVNYDKEFGSSIVWIQKLMLTAFQKVPDIYLPYASECFCAFWPGKLASRAEVFDFAKNILSLNSDSALAGISFELKNNPEVWVSPDEPIILYLKKWNLKTEVDRGYIENPLLIWKFLIYDWSSTGGKMKKIFDTNSNEIIDAVVWWKVDNAQKYIFGCSGAGGSSCSIFSLEKWRVVYANSSPEDSGKVWTDMKYLWNWKFQIIDEDQTIINVDISKARTNYEKEELWAYILSLYYWRINQSSLHSAYAMRSPAWVSYETFRSWYNSDISLLTQSGTLKALWDNTYEFLIESIQGQKTEMYKIKSKVNLENFTIENISSVKL